MNNAVNLPKQVNNAVLTQDDQDALARMKVAAAKALEAGQRSKRSQADSERYLQKMQSAAP